MKNFNRRSSHGHHGSKRRELAPHAHSRGSYAFTHTPTSTQLRPRCAKRQLSYYIIWNSKNYCQGTGGRGIKPEYPEKPPDSLPANRYHVLEEENPTFRTGIEPSPSTIGEKLAWPRAGAASDPLSHRPPQIAHHINTVIMMMTTTMMMVMVMFIAVLTAASIPSFSIVQKTGNAKHTRTVLHFEAFCFRNCIDNLIVNFQIGSFSSTHTKEVFIKRKPHAFSPEHGINYMCIQR